MHELGILRQIAKIVDQTAVKNRIAEIKDITLEVGRASGIVPYYLRKLFPLAADAFPILKNTRLKICLVRGKGLVIRSISY